MAQYLQYVLAATTATDILYMLFQKPLSGAVCGG